jgi:hypothetical protein
MVYLVHCDAVPYLKHWATKVTAESLKNCPIHIAASPVYVDSWKIIGTSLDVAWRIRAGGFHSARLILEE